MVGATDDMCVKMHAQESWARGTVRAQDSNDRGPHALEERVHGGGTRHLAGGTREALLLNLQRGLMVGEDIGKSWRARETARER